MIIGNMSIEELEAREKDLKVEYYDIEARKMSIVQEINNIENIKEQKQNEVAPQIEETQYQEDSVAIAPTVENEVTSEAPVQEETIVEETVLPQVEEAQYQENSEAVTPIVENGESIQEEVTEPIFNAPLIQPEVEVQENIPGPQQLDQTPLTPAGMDIQNIQTEPVNNKNFIKIDSNNSRAILMTSEQAQKSRASKDNQERMVMNNGDATELNSPVIEVPTVEQVTTTPIVNTSPTTEVVSESKEDINKQLEDMFEQLRSTTDEAKANEINNQISVLTKKLGEVV